MGKSALYQDPASTTGNRGDMLPWYAFVDDYGAATGDIMGRVTTSGGVPSGAEAERAASIVAALGKSSGSEDVFAAFEELDSLPPDVVRAVLTPWTGPAPDPQNLDAATRAAHGFAALPLEVRTVSILKPSSVEQLSRVAQEQVRAAGMTWDGLDLHATARLASDGLESSFAGTLEHRAVTDVEGKPLFDVLLYGADSGAIFRAGTTQLVGAIAYGTVEMTDRRARVALQGSLATSSPEAVTRKVQPVASTARVAEAESQAEPSVSSGAPTARTVEPRAVPEKRAALTKTSAKSSAVKAAPAKSATVKEAVAKSATVKKAAATETAAKKTATTKTATAKTTATKTAAKKTAAVKTAPKKTAATKTAATKTAAKKTAAKKTAATKTVAKKTAATKTAAKKTAPKKTVAATTPAAKKTAAKKTAPKKTAAKKTAAKKTAPKKTAARKTTKR